MLDEFISWVTGKYGYSYMMHTHELSSSVVVDFETDDVIGRFTIWDDFSSMRGWFANMRIIRALVCQICGV